ncbi:MAG: cyclic pyranopterin monophosphate synthase MoaC [Planctomycetota bacterium]|jgi:cyclic pyranopterin phosphate synthase|nr:cyclic pyranopterin monophosphate synthase MoaC [Planctomycetota bacterium]
MSDSASLSHLADDGSPRMVDVGGKQPTARMAQAEAIVRYPIDTFNRVLAGDLPKGGIIEPARIAGIMAAKRTSELIPMCHGLQVEQVEVSITPLKGEEPAFQVLCSASLTGKTGVEMEAMTGATVAALTLYDMTKGLDKGIVIEKVRLLKKSGGKSSEWQAQ